MIYIDTYITYILYPHIIPVHLTNYIYINFLISSGILNSVAISVVAILHAHPTLKIAIFDYDVHDGDGTAEIVRYIQDKHPDLKDRILFLSVHMFGKGFFPNIPSLSEPDNNVYKAPVEFEWTEKMSNAKSKKQSPTQRKKRLKLERERIKASKEGFKKAVEEMLVKLRNFEPDMIFVSAGYDAGKNDIGCSKNVS